MLEKNHNHTELPHHDHMPELEEKDIQNAVAFYAGEDTLQEMPVATSADVRHAWGPVDPDDLDALNIVALETDDKAALEALEEKQEKQRKKEAAKKKLPSKNTSANLAKIQKQLQKTKDTNTSGITTHHSESSSHPATPSPPPPNQLQGGNPDLEKTPRNSEFQICQPSLVELIFLLINQNLL